MRVISFICSLIFCTVSTGIAQSPLWLEDFDGSNIRNLPSWSYQSFCSVTDYFDIVCADRKVCPESFIKSYFYKGSNGHFLAARDMDHKGCSANLEGETISFKNIEIQSCEASNNLYLCFSVAESRNVGHVFGLEWGNYCNCEDTWDANTFVKVSTSIDGSKLNLITAIEAIGGSNTRPAIDINCNGKSGDDNSAEISDVFTQYCFELKDRGSLLDIQFEFAGFNTGGEDIAFDNIAIYCLSPDDILAISATLIESCDTSSTSNN
jgi:hypothetical protein